MNELSPWVLDISHNFLVVVPMGVLPPTAAAGHDHKEPLYTVEGQWRTQDADIEQADNIEDTLNVFQHKN